jgi:hypothetical protein
VFKRFGLAGLVLLMVASPLCADDKQSLRDDAMRLMGAGVLVPGVAVYCNKFVEPNERLLTAAAHWSKRHEPLLRQIVRVFEWSGGMSAEDRDKLDRFAFKLVRQTVDGQEDKPGYCRHMASEIEAGNMDLQNGSLADSVQRIMGADLD